VRWRTEVTAPTSLACFQRVDFSFSTMSMSSVHTLALSARTDAEDESAIERVLTAPECDALPFYRRLSSALQWQARMRATGQRRAVLVEYHALNVAQLR